jgi:hypothetical protein
MSEEQELLKKLLEFYKKRYDDGIEFDTKFGAVVEDLIQTGDIKRGTFVKFCMDNDIEPIKPAKPVRSTYSSSSSSDSCGGGGRQSSGC